MTRQLSPGNRCNVFAFSSAVETSLTCGVGYHQFVPFAVQYHHRITLQYRCEALPHLAVPLLQQTPERTLVDVGVTFFIATTAHQRCNAETAMPNRTCQRHVKQTQIFRQTFGLREVDAFWRSIKIQNCLKRVAIVIKRLLPGRGNW